MVSIPPGSRLGRYQIVERIGWGGMATVFRAYDPELNRHVAVKVLPSFQAEDPTFVKRFRQEAQSIARLNHPTHPRNFLAMVGLTGSQRKALRDGVAYNWAGNLQLLQLIQSIGIPSNRLN